MATKEELARLGCAGYSRFSVLGRGRQRGLRNQTGQEVVPFLPKVLFDVVVDDEDAAETVEAFIRANQTGQYGDGKIFVLEVCETYRISTPPGVEACVQVGGVSPQAGVLVAHP